MSDEKIPMEQQEEYEPDILTLEDEEGVEHTFEVLDAAEYEDERYLALVPYSEDPDERLAEDAEMILMKVSEEDGEEVLDLVDDEDELYNVGQVFMKRLSEVYNIDVEELAAQLEEEEDDQE